MTDSDSPDTGDDIDVERAEAEAREAEALAASLEHAAVHSDTMPEPGEIERAEQLGRWARLRADRVRLRAARAAEARRVAGCVAIHDEIEAAATNGGAEIARLLVKLDAAEAAVIAAAKRHDDQAQEWRSRAAALGVPETANPPRPEDGLLKLSPSGSSDKVQTDTRTVGTFGGANLVEHFHASAPDDRKAIIADVRKAGLR